MSYLAFLAPGLLAATAMQSASFEATFPIMGGLVWNKIFHAMYATPISPRDIALGNLAWIAARLTFITTVFTVVIVLFGAAASPLVVLAIPAAVLTGLAFAAPIAAFSATQRTPDRFSNIFRFGITPLFLFSGTFFPLTSLPAFLQPLAWLTPLYHGVALTRGLSLGTIVSDPVFAVVHLVALLAFIAAGTWALLIDDGTPAGARMTAPTLRIIPVGLAFGSRRSVRLIERNLYVYKHGWLVILSGFFEPLFYLLGIGFGLGALIGTINGPAGQPISYQLFVAPALLTTAAMNGAINESTFNFFFKLNYDKTFASILATPLSPGDIALGELGWALIRGGLYALGFMAVMARASGWSCRRGSSSPCPAALLVGFAFGAVGMAATSFMRTWQDFDLIQLVVLPMFLFSGTFYPVDAYPDAAPGRRPADAALPGRGPDPVAGGRRHLADPAVPRGVPRALMGIAGLVVDLAADRPAAAQVGHDAMAGLA